MLPTPVRWLAAAMACVAGAAHADTVTLRVLSSPAEYVSGGDARIEIVAPAARQDRKSTRLNSSH